MGGWEREWGATQLNHALPSAAEDPHAMPFRPGRHGFRFANRFDAPLGLAPALRAAGLPATWGLCGGMVHAARAAFERSEALPQHGETPPAPGAPLYRRLLRRQVASLGPPPLFPEVWRFARWTRRPDADLARRTRPEREQAQRRLDEGRLVPLGLIYTRRLRRLWENHQVLAYAAAGEALRIYDPNEPGRDDVTLAHAPGDDGPVFEKCRAGRPVRPVRGFFVMRDT